MEKIPKSQTTNEKGNYSESIILSAYLREGFIVSTPFGGGAPYDLIVDAGTKLIKVQVKTGRLRNGCVNYWTRNNSGRGQRKRRHYVEGEVDLFAIFCPDNGMIYAVPAHSLVQGSLRIIDAANNQQQKVRWAKDYAWEEHIKELRQEQKRRTSTINENEFML